ncbi:hypothetical protein ACFIJ5_07545 [Haloimpatiens sp. FM7330]|uniref:hypothetical protein n=1 Tax=Haloimpatiens sp. FM7330 TaxID=3298610 RepID=UPI00363A0460
MDKRKISISFSKEYEDLYEHIKYMNNRSNFICQAIKEKLYKDTSNNDLQELIETALIKVLSTSPNINIDSNISKRNIISEQDKELINNIF